MKEYKLSRYYVPLHWDINIKDNTEKYIKKHD